MGQSYLCVATGSHHTVHISMQYAPFNHTIKDILFVHTPYTRNALVFCSAYRLTSVGASLRLDRPLHTDRPGGGVTDASPFRKM